MYDSFSKGTVKPEKRTIASFLRNQASAKRFSSDITLISPAVSARGSSTVVVRETEITFSQSRNVRKDVHAFSLRKLDRVKPRSVDITTTTAPENAKSSITEVAWET